MYISKDNHARAPLHAEIRAMLPGCRAFVSRFWGVHESLAEPAGITIRDEGCEGGSACVIGSERRLVLYAENFREGGRKRIERALVHELTHLVSISVLDRSHDSGRCIAEGLALLATDAYMSEDCDVSGKDLAYFNGKRFIRALCGGGVRAEDMHPLLRDMPTVNELFFPSRYLERLGISHVLDSDRPAMEPSEWARLAMRQGMEHAWRNERGEGTEAFFPKRKHVQAPGNPKGVPRNLLHSPESYGAGFFLSLERHLGGMEKALEAIRRVPPEGPVRSRGSVAHIIEPFRYLIVPEVWELRAARNQ